LPLQKDEIVDYIGVCETDDSFFEVRNFSGEEGLVPKNALKVCKIPIQNQFS
jgi:hypothetical protein